ncbi:hypothetical protein N8I74_06330 [Chitiniphilus purpureus]|uniref:DUF1090 family protein n=1 Tax=Chitiniphilus purpureus TaxID=2981137 RepID=A0ABY6DQI7_9NEIS|nr:hypothetical protein [Chitiniphilus sp. CD1]UXY16632.1 hypothetical protein N8I74_06330 [Chitiniphilus sp. CD1]
MVAARRCVMLVLLVFAGATPAAPTQAPAPVPTYYRADPGKLMQLERARCGRLLKEQRLITARLARERYRHNVDRLRARLAEVDAEYARFGRCAQVMPTPTPTAVPTPAATPMRRR